MIRKVFILLLVPLFIESHLYLIISSEKELLSAIMRGFKKHTNKKNIKELYLINESRKEWLLRAFTKSANKLKRVKSHKVWQDGNHPILLDTAIKTEQRLHYIHNNPVDDKIVDEPSHYLYSSARDYHDIKGLLEIEFLH